MIPESLYANMTSIEITIIDYSPLIIFAIDIKKITIVTLKS